MKTIWYASGCILRVRRCTLVIEVRAVYGGLTARRDACAAVAERRSKHYMLHVIMLSRVSCLLCQRIKPLPLLRTNCHHFVLPARLPRQLGCREAIWRLQRPCFVRAQISAGCLLHGGHVETHNKEEGSCSLPKWATSASHPPLDTSVVPVPIHRIHYSLSLLEFFII